MSGKTSSLADALKEGIQNRPTGRLQGMLGKESPRPVAVPLAQDAYEIQVDHLHADPEQPRQVFDEEELENLAASIRENGVLQPLLVYQRDGVEGYTIIAGERRWRASVRAGRMTVPCLVMSHDFDPALIDQVQLVENIQRADLEPLEAARAVQAFMDQHNLSQREAAGRLGKPKTWIAELLGILTIPRQLLDRGKELPKHALIQVSRIKNEAEQGHLLERLLSSPAPFYEAQMARRKGTPKETVHRYREVFLLENEEPIEIRWKRHPDEVTPLELAERLGAVIRELVARHGRQ